MYFKDTLQIEKFLLKHISKNPQKIFRGKTGLNELKTILEKIGDPQNKIKIIHIAGTSGKGSTANFISQILSFFGFKVGLHVSPHLLDVRERFQINNGLIRKQKFCQYFNEWIMLMEKIDKYNRLTYFEILTIFSFYIFFREGVDYAVIETGLGGLYDATNTVSSTNKMVVLTRIGLDHTNILGNTIAKIAYQKAMIIQNKNIVISLWQKSSARQIIEKIVHRNKASLFYIKKNVNYSILQQKIDKTIFDFKFDNYYLKNIKLSMIGLHQVENCSLALTTVLLLAKRDHFVCQLAKIKNLLENVNFPGRMEIRKIRGKTVILDGAHNPQKISSLIETLKAVFRDDKKFNFLIAFKNGKDFPSMINKIIPIADKIIVTTFFQDNQDMLNFSVSPLKIGSYLKKSGFKNYRTISDPREAVKYLIKNSSKPIVVTGSLYLISELYKRSL